MKNRIEQARFVAQANRTMPNLNLTVVYRRIETLKPDPTNPRVHSKTQIRHLKNNIGKFGFIVPLLVNAELKVIAGHGRLLAGGELGIAEVPTICLDHLTAAQARAFAIADNRLTEIATWDDRLLAEQLKELSLLELDFSLELTGFEMGEIDLRIASLKEVPDPADDPTDVVPEIPPGVPISKEGDLWRLGEHRVLCGSALDPADFVTLMAAERAAMVFTDPPYNVPIDGHASGLGAIHHRPFPMASGEMAKTEFTAFLSQACHNLAAFSAGGSLHFICMDWRHLLELLTAGHMAYSELENVCVWVKSNGGMGSLYRSRHELVFVFKSGRHGHRPTVKPVALVADALLDCSARGDIVLDSFLGSGTSIIAAERSGRRCYGMELDPAYVDTIIRRWQALTGGNACHAASNRSFDDLACEAEAADAA
jgi:DNA modification methylase